MATWNQSSTCSASGATCCWTARKPASPSVRTVIDVVSVTPHWRMARSTALIASEPPLRTKAKRVACPSRSSAFPAITSKFRSGRWCRFLTYPPSNPTINSLHSRCDEPVASASADFCSRLPTFIVRLRTVLGSGLCGQRQKLAQEISDLSKRQQRSHLGREIPQLGRDRTLVCEQCGEAVRVPSRARASSYSPDTHANVPVYRTKSGLVIALRA